MFKVVFWKSVWNGSCCEASTSFSIFQRTEELPFMPSPLIQFSWQLSLLPETPKSVCWFSDEQQFVCTMPDEFPYEIKECKYDYEWLVKQAKNCGWIFVSEQHTQ